MKEIIATTNAPGAVGPYVQAVKANGMVYCSGQLGIDPATGKMPATVEEQAHFSMKNMGAILAESKSIAIITKDDTEAEYVYNLIKDEEEVSLVDGFSHIKRDLVIMPSYVAKGLEFDSVISYNSIDNRYEEKDKYLYYVTCTRAQHNLIIYNGMKNN